MAKSNEERFDESCYAAFRISMEQAKLKLALLKENFEYREWFAQWRAGKSRKEEGFPGNMFKRFGLVGLRFYIGHPNWQNVLDLIDPQKDITESPFLPLLFYDHAVNLVEVENEADRDGGMRETMWAIKHRGLKPGQRLFKVDLTQKKSQIMKEFSEYLNRAYMRAANWTPDNSRETEKAWQHLAVWKLRRKRKSFSDIAKDQKITKDAAKKSFYRAFEMITGSKFDTALFKRDYWEIRQEDIGRQCKTCSNHPDNGGDCNELCPDMLAYVNQDDRYQREKFSEDYQIDNLTEEENPETLLIAKEENR